MRGKFQGHPANGASLDRFLIYRLGNRKTAEIWPMLNFFLSESFKILARGTGLIKHRQKKKKFGTYFFAQSDLNFFWPNPMAEIKTPRKSPSSHRVTESQSDRHLRVGKIFLCLISIYSPTRFVRRGIITIF